MTTFATLRRYNLAAGVLHALSAVAVVALSNDFALPVNANYMAARLRGDAHVFQRGGVRQDVGDLVGEFSLPVAEIYCPGILE